MGTRSRILAALASILGSFVLCLAWLGPLGARLDALVVIVAALVALIPPTLIARVESARGALLMALGTSLTAGAIIGLIVLLAGASLSHFYIVHPEGPLAIWIAAGFGRAAASSPIALLLRRGAPLTSRDAIDRALLAASVWFAAALIESTAVVYYSIRLSRATYGGLAGPLLGPGFLALVVLGALTAFAVLVRGARWLLLWRNVRSSAGWRVVPESQWSKSPPATEWFHVAGAAPDAVVVRTVAREQAAYREGDLEIAVARVPSDSGRVTRVILARMMAGCVLLALFCLTIAGPLGRLRW